MAKGEELLSGVGASKGEIVGIVRVVNGDEDKKMKIVEGEIMVTDRTTPDDIMYMKKAAAFITNSGGKLSHTGIVAREMGRPAVVGTIEGTTVLKTGQKIVIDGAAGKVYAYVPDKDEPKAAGGSLADKMAAMAVKKGVNLSADFMQKMKDME